MKKFFTLLCAVLGSLMVCHAEMLFTETFDARAVGDLKAGDYDAITSDGQWYNSLGSSFIQVVDQQLNLAGYADSPSGKAAQATANHGKDFIIFANHATSGKVYMSFLLQVDELKTTSGAKGNSNLIAALWTDLSSNASGKLYNQVKIMTVDDSHYQLGIAKRTETAQFADALLETGKTYLVVTEYIFMDELDSANLYINPTKESKVVAQCANLNLTSAKTDAMGFYGMVLATNGNTPANMLIDEIRVANYWDNLFGEEGDDPEPVDVPAIQADDEVVLGEEDGFTYSTKTYERALTVTGEHLNGDISISHTNSAITLSTETLGKAGGTYTISLINPDKAGEQSDVITLSCGEVSKQTVVKWTNVLVKPAEGTDLLVNGSFENYKVETNPLLGTNTSFDAWAWSAFGATAEASDKQDGEVAMRVQPTIPNGTLDQQVLIGDEFEAGDIFELKFHYKASNLNSGQLSLDCYWEPAGGGDSEAMKQHDADKLQVVLASESGSAWVSHTVNTYKPSGARYFRVRLNVSAKASDVLFDQFSLTYIGHTDPDEPVVPDPPTPEDPSEEQWSHAFDWNLPAPLALMIEPFDNVSHNKPAQVDGWQNVAAAEQRPWWGFDEAKTSPARGTDRYVKATAYQYATESTGEWEMWLVTPALDYKNAGSKMFTFSIMGEYLPDEDNATLMEVYYIDPTNPSDVLFQNLTESFDIPRTADVAEEWQTFYLNLAPFAETVADVFCMAFHFKGPNGNEGAVTYYIDDVSWGRTDLPMITPDKTALECIVAAETDVILDTITVSTANVTSPITLTVEGSNYDKFSLSTETLPAEGGSFTVRFNSDQIGVHEAYIRLSSPDAADVFIPMSVLCKEQPQGIDVLPGESIAPVKILRNGILYWMYKGRMYNMQGQEVR